MSDFRVLVTGSRDHPKRGLVFEALDAVLFDKCQPGGKLTVVHGACPTGADAYASEWCQLWSAQVIEEKHPADWNTCTERCYHKPRPDGRCPAAGPRRNGEMVALGADLVLGFPLPGAWTNSRGTYNCLRQAMQAGLEVKKLVYSV